MWIGIATAALIWGWFFLGLAAHGWLPKFKLLTKRFDDPGEIETWAIRVTAVALIVAGVWASQHEEYPFWNGLWPELVGIGVTVLGIDELGRRRAERQYKQQVIGQIKSRSKEFGLDATRIAREKRWCFDGSLKGVDLSEANLEGVDFRRAYMEEADLSIANLKGANFVRAKLARVSFTAANLEGAYLDAADLEEGYLLAVNLECATLTAANLKSADLRSANLKGADLSWANIKEATYDLNTAWPDGFDAAAAGAVLVE